MSFSRALQPTPVSKNTNPHNYTPGEIYMRQSTGFRSLRWVTRLVDCAVLLPRYTLRSKYQMALRSTQQVTWSYSTTGSSATLKTEDLYFRWLRQQKRRNKPAAKAASWSYCLLQGTSKFAHSFLNYESKPDWYHRVRETNEQRKLIVNERIFFYDTGESIRLGSEIAESKRDTYQ